MSDATRLLNAIEQGDPTAAEELLPLVYEELRRLASQRMANEAPGQTLQPTALVHEAYLRLVGSTTGHWNSRGHFFAAAAEAMRRILVENARRKQRLKHGGGLQRIDLTTSLDIAMISADANVIAVDEALNKLAQHYPRVARLIELRFFAGLSPVEAARLLEISESTATRDWRFGPGSTPRRRGWRAIPLRTTARPAERYRGRTAGWLHWSLQAAGENRRGWVWRRLSCRPAGAC